jgi:L-fuculose-phosphate aldolase
MLLSRSARRTARTLLAVADSLRVAGLLSTGGNLSARLHQDEFLVTPTGFSVDRLGQIHPRDLIRMNIRAQPPRLASVEASLHALLYSRLPKVGGVCHAHAPATMALGDPGSWPRLTASARKFDPVHVAWNQSGAPLTAEVAEILDDPDKATGHYGFALAVPGHGLFTAASSLQRALYLLMRIEENSTVAILHQMTRPCDRP